MSFSGHIGRILVATCATLASGPIALSQQPAAVTPAADRQPPAAAAARQPVAGSPAAGELVQQALRCRSLGNGDFADLLTRALTVDPRSEPAHWHSGFVHDSGRWFKYDAVAVDRRLLDRYETERGRQPDTRGGHEAMAEWCREQKLAMQERAHWSKVLTFDADHTRARARLGYVRVEGNWVARSEIESTRRRKLAVEQAFKKWSVALRPIRAAFESEDPNQMAAARQKLAAIRDVEAIPVMETMLSRLNLEAATAVVFTIRRMQGPEAAVGLARQAVFAEWYPVGKQAAEALRGCDELSYVPLMLSALATPPGDTFQVSIYPGEGPGKLLVRYEFERELQGRTEKVTYDVSYGAWTSGKVPVEVAHANDQYAVPANARPLTMLATAEVNRQVAAARDAHYRGLLQLKAEVGQAKVAAQVEEETRSIKNLNGRICRALRTATGTPDGEMTTDSPRTWWDWWNERREVFVRGLKPVTYSNFSSQEIAELPRYIPPPTRVVSASCLVAGTTVYTDVGPRPVEEIRLGDRVLSQNVETGELSFRVVLEPTVRPAAPTVVLKFGDRQVRATGGHPFWAVGRGWMKAREFEPGMRMASVGGTVEVTGIEPAGDLPAFNLVVDEFHTYFVGDVLILSHDNLPPQPTRGGLPGAATTR